MFSQLFNKKEKHASELTPTRVFVSTFFFDRPYRLTMASISTLAPIGSFATS